MTAAAGAAAAPILPASVFAFGGGGAAAFGTAVFSGVPFAGSGGFVVAGGVAAGGVVAVGGFVPAGGVADGGGVVAAGGAVGAGGFAGAVGGGVAGAVGAGGFAGAADVPPGCGDTDTPFDPDPNTAPSASVTETDTLNEPGSVQLIVGVCEIGFDSEQPSGATVHA